MPIRFVSFDAGGTLLIPHPSVGAVYSRAGRPHGLTASPDALEAAFRIAWRHHVTGDPRVAAEMGHDDASTRAFWRRLVGDVLVEVGFTGDEEACFTALFDGFAAAEAWRVFDDVRPTLAGLRARGVRTGVLSNWDHRLRPLLGTLGLAPDLDPVVVSAEVGLAKPDPRIFDLVCARAATPPEETLHVGDHRDLDFLPARAAGLRAYLIDRTGARDPKGRPSEGERLSTLEEILSIVDHAS